MNQVPEHLPTLDTKRLRLRPLQESDIPRVVELAGEREVADGTLTMPHPYEESDAREFVEKVRSGIASGKGVAFAIADRETDELVGCCGIDLLEKHRSGEIGYWIGKPYWSRGYASEAVRALIAWCFSALEVDKVFGRVFDGNAGSSRVLEKIGMRKEGFLRKHLVRWDERRDVEQWGLLAEEWNDGRRRE